MKDSFSEEYCLKEDFIEIEDKREIFISNISRRPC